MYVNMCTESRKRHNSRLTACARVCIFVLTRAVETLLTLSEVFLSPSPHLLHAGCWSELG